MNGDGGTFSTMGRGAIAPQWTVPPGKEYEMLRNAMPNKIEVENDEKVKEEPIQYRSMTYEMIALVASNVVEKRMKWPLRLAAAALVLSIIALVV
jgi:hypothetical protein